jgi:hypothetical protein
VDLRKVSFSALTQKIEMGKIGAKPIQSPGEGVKKFMQGIFHTSLTYKS